MQYPSHIRWRKTVSEDPFKNFGKNRARELKKFVEENTGSVRSVIEPLTEDFFEWFMPVYEAEMQKKDNPKIFDVRAKTLDKVSEGKAYFSSTLYDNNEKLGGVIFRMDEDTLYVAYRTVAYKWAEASFRAAPALVAEFDIERFAFEQQRFQFSHGKDRNPYGVNASIGLAMFKLSVGCQPMMPKAEELVLHNESLPTDTDSLTMIAAEPEQKITHALLYTTKEYEQKWQQVTKYPDLVEIETRYRT